MCIQINTFVIIIAVILAATGGGNQTKTALRLLEENVENVRELDKTVTLAYYDNLSAGEALSDYDHEALNSQIAKFVDFEKALSKINANGIASDARGNFQKLQNRTNSMSTEYQLTLALYNSIYQSYKDRSLDPLASFKDSEDENINFIYKRLSKTIGNEQYWQNKLAEGNCANASNNDNCKLAQGYLDEEMNSFDTSTALIRSTFSTYIKDAPKQEDSLTRSIEALIEALK